MKVRLKQYQNRFVEFLVEEKILLFGEYVTKSGRNTPYFINLGLCDNGYRLSILSRIYARHIFENVDVGYGDVLFGPAYKGIGLVSSISKTLYEAYGWNHDFVYNRKEIKDHGEKGVLVGRQLRSDDKIIIVDDVITAGTALAESEEVLGQYGAPKIVAMVIGIDRMEKKDGSKSTVEMVRERGIRVSAIVDIRQIVNHCERRGLVDRELKKKIEAYWDRYLGI